MSRLVRWSAEAGQARSFGPAGGAMLPSAGPKPFQRNTRESAKLLITIQANNGVASVSKTGIESIKSVASIFNIVDLESLKSRALRYGFAAINEEENRLPNDNSLFTYAFSRIPPASGS